jgi:general stress protein 26
VSVATNNDARADQESLYRVDQPEEILKAARLLMESDENVALVTVDANGQPRVRTVRAFLTDVDEADPRSAVTVWVMTRNSTRKVEQIRRHREVTLYFNDDPKVSYLTVMGTATIHTNPDHPAIESILARKTLEGYAEYFWPEYPNDFVMIEIRPKWIEFMGPGISNHPEHWRPQAVEFGKQ